MEYEINAYRVVCSSFRITGDGTAENEKQDTYTYPANAAPLTARRKAIDHISGLLDDIHAALDASRTDGAAPPLGYHILIYVAVKDDKLAPFCILSLSNHKAGVEMYPLEVILQNRHFEATVYTGNNYDTGGAIEAVILPNSTQHYFCLPDDAKGYKDQLRVANM